MGITRRFEDPRPPAQAAENMPPATWQPPVGQLKPADKDRLITGLIVFLFLDCGPCPWDRAQSGDYWNPNKEISGADFIEFASSLLAELGLRPESPSAVAGR